MSEDAEPAPIVIEWQDIDLDKFKDNDSEDIKTLVAAIRADREAMSKKLEELSQPAPEPTPPTEDPEVTKLKKQIAALEATQEKTQKDVITADLVSMKHPVEGMDQNYSKEILSAVRTELARFLEKNRGVPLPQYAKRTPNKTGKTQYFDFQKKQFRDTPQ